MRAIESDPDLSGLLRRLGVVVFRRAADSSLRFTEVEGRCAERMGLSKSSLTGDAYSFWPRVVPADRGRVIAVLEEAIRKGSEYRVAYRLTADDGRVRRIREEGAAMLGSDDSVVALQGVILEAADELAEAPEESTPVGLRPSEQRFRELIDAAQDAICENELVRGDILYANPRFYAMHGYDVEAARDIRLVDLLHPEDRERIQNVCQAFQRGELGDSRVGTLLYRSRHKDGDYRWFEASGQLFRGAQGEARSAAVIRDVTAREETRKALERRLEDQRRIANLARDLLALGVDEIDAGVLDGLVSLLPISRADRTWLVADDPVRDRDQIWEWSAEGVAPPGIAMGQISLSAHPHARGRFQAGCELVLPDASLPNQAPETRFLQRRNATSLLAIPLLSGRDLIGVLGFERISEPGDWSEETLALLRLGGEVLASAISRKGAEALLRESRGQLLQAQKMEAVGTLAGGVAHDFNNQLSVILGNARFVHDRLAPDVDLQEAMTDLKRAGEHCAHLTRSLLSFSRHTPAQRKATSVAQVLADVRELTSPMIGGAIHFETLVHDEFDAVFADRTQLQQVLVNLVVNASDAMPDGGTLSIRTERRSLDAAEAERLGVPAPGEYVLFVVADTGFGIDEDTLGRIFEPFFTTKQQGKGTGLGLATVYGIVQESKGRVWAESEPGLGTTFRLLLPLAHGGGEEPPTRAGGGLEGGETLLLVEDDESVRRLLRRMLSRMGFHVVEAANGAAALELAKQYPGEIDVVLSDVSMPQMGGVELGRRLLQLRPTLRVLLVTGHAEDDVSLPGARLLCKPFRREELAWALEALLSGKPDRT